MELFALHCTTCKARLKVTDSSVIGDIVSCPKCHSMVLVEPPPGWSPAAASAAAVAPVPAVAKPNPPAAVAQKPVAAPKLPAAPLAAARVSAQTPPPLPSPPALPVAPPTAAAAPAIATPTARIPRETWMFAGGVAAGIAVGAGLWLALSLRGSSDAPVAASVASAADVEAVESPAKPPIEPSVQRVETLKPVVEETIPLAEPDTEASVAEVQSADAPEIESETPPTAVEEPVEEPADAEPATTEETPAEDKNHASEPPAAVEESPAEVEPAKVEPPTTGPPSDAVSSRLARRMPGIAFDKVPLRQFTAFAEELSGVKIVIDRESLAGANIQSPVVSVRASNETLEKVLTRALEQAGLRFEARDEAIVILAR